MYVGNSRDEGILSWIPTIWSDSASPRGPEWNYDVGNCFSVLVSSQRASEFNGVQYVLRLGEMGSVIVFRSSTPEVLYPQGMFPSDILRPSVQAP